MPWNKILLLSDLKCNLEEILWKINLSGLLVIRSTMLLGQKPLSLMVLNVEVLYDLVKMLLICSSISIEVATCILGVIFLVHFKNGGLLFIADVLEAT